LLLNILLKSSNTVYNTGTTTKVKMVEVNTPPIKACNTSSTTNNNHILRVVKQRLGEKKLNRV
jgi:hypothetical protein